VSARGVTFDARFPRYRAGDEAWDSAWRTAVRHARHANAAGDRDLGWSTELAIPWDELCRETAVVCPPAPGMRLRINAFRLERPDRKAHRRAGPEPDARAGLPRLGQRRGLELQ
jgi:hypothetical protein